MYDSNASDASHNRKPASRLAAVASELFPDKKLAARTRKTRLPFFLPSTQACQLCARLAWKKDDGKNGGNKKDGAKRKKRSGKAAAEEKEDQEEEKTEVEIEESEEENGGTSQFAPVGGWATE